MQVNRQGAGEDRMSVCIETRIGQIRHLRLSAVQCDDRGSFNRANVTAGADPPSQSSSSGFASQRMSGAKEYERTQMVIKR